MSKSSLDSHHEKRVEYKKPSLYNVVILNDDYTLIEFVVIVLVEVFHVPNQQLSMSAGE